MGASSLLAGCGGNQHTKETKENVQQSADEKEAMKVYQDVHKKYDEKMNKELNQSVQLWGASEGKRREIDS